MVAYVSIAPVAGAFASRLPRRQFLIALDVIRAVIVLFLPFVDQIWQIYILIFLMQAASAASTPTFQATIPDLLTDKDEYTKALSLSRLAYDLENLVSPLLAGALLTVMSFHWLFAGTALGFVLSAALIFSVLLPAATRRRKMSGIWDETTLGIRSYLATPRLRGLLALSLVASAGGAMVIVNTVVYVRNVLAGGEADVALALAIFGAGSMVTAFLLPLLYSKIADRTVMLLSALGMIGGLLGLGCISAAGWQSWSSFYLTWLALGLCSAALQLPAGRLLRMSADEARKPAIFAAQFSLSHACWLITYPLAGLLGAKLGMINALFGLAAVAVTGLIAAALVWPSHDPEHVEHSHAGLAPDHSHWSAGERVAPDRHVHAFVIDDLHEAWPSRRPHS